MNIFVLNGREGADKSPIYNTIDFEEKIELNDWHSFCTSIDVVNNVVLVAQNGKIIAKSPFELTHNEGERLRRLMPVAEIGAITGSVADVQVFKKPLTEEEIKKWTLCMDIPQVIK